MAANPFAVPAANPFATPAPATNPFASAAPNPFSAPSTGNPFAPAPATNPFAPATPAANPFAAPAAGAASANPFAPAAPTGTATANPFAPATTTTQAPTAGAAVAPNPYGTVSIDAEKSRIWWEYVRNFYAIFYNAAPPQVLATIPPHEVFTFFPLATLPPGVSRPTATSPMPPPIQEMLVAWMQAAIQHNPNPKGLVPTILFTFKEMRQRVEQQSQRLAALRSNLHDFEEELGKLQQHNDLHIDMRLNEHRREHVKIGQSLISVMKKLEVLQGGGRRGLTGDECGLRSKLEYLQSELNRPTKFKATLNELEPLLERMSRTARPAEAPAVLAGTADDPNAPIQKILQDQRAGIEQLAQVIRDDARDLNILRERLTARLQGATAPPR